MVLGMSLETYTAIHVAISLIGIVTGFIVAFAFMKARNLDSMALVFLTTTVLTSVTGFGFPFEHLLPSHIVGILSLVILAAAIMARYSFQMAGPWRKVYVIGSVAALYFNVFVLVVQSFQKVPLLNALAPTQSEPPFAIAQVIVLALMITLGTLAVKRFREQPAAVRAKAAAQG